MSVATVSSKGQITLPADARRAAGVRVGDRVLVSVRGNTIVIEPVLDFFALKGALGPALSPAREAVAMQREATLHDRNRT